LGFGASSADGSREPPRNTAINSRATVIKMKGPTATSQKTGEAFASAL
jgi:hypothetical protein